MSLHRSKFLVSIMLIAVVIFFIAFNVNIAVAQADVTSPGDPVSVVSGQGDVDINDSPTPPIAEDEPHAIDNTTDKYLNFRDFNSGIIVTPAIGSTLISGLRLYTANDNPDRDPASYLLEGSNAGIGGPFTLIAQGLLALPAARNAPSLAIDLTRNHQQLNFANNTSYTTYRIIFPTLKNAAATQAMQIGEIEFLLKPPSVPASNIGGIITFMMLLAFFGMKGYRKKQVGS